ncbi:MULTISPECIES: GFA family protein [Pseudoalteromonas]|uniref:CENP-V/GFA domain-containing protein n=1 Tax=Pseudoalteromonas luteoviolacea (strain 2ta16) TaxID=1353533 RepID=V4HJ43_PSEL2|nr:MULTISPECIES: GFA family protein [Pseudoalteromonas]ESP90810.1 hypothetical protein PL2TA16_01914 [Pseudoalteromonas luteoviolacea 2ta16]KZN41615.1 hypothetical protein N483_13175 [Pseudoalteromonas luteoviolacea NCIMB 1944]MCG7548220.1 GFA family protein [Pseudoalteromonas sp. Of7M-16]
MDLSGSCHCGNIAITLKKAVDLVTSCNCSLCHRYGAIWGYFELSEVELTVTNSQVKSYQHGDQYLAFHHCSDCGCVTHYTPTEKYNTTRMAVNLRMFDKALLNEVSVRYFDGADSWDFVEQSEPRFFV